MRIRAQLGRFFWGGADGEIEDADAIKDFVQELYKGSKSCSFPLRSVRGVKHQKTLRRGGRKREQQTSECLNIFCQNSVQVIVVVYRFVCFFVR